MLKEIVTGICELYGLKFDSAPAMKDLRGIFQVNLCLMYAFKYRAAEGVYLNNEYKITVKAEAVEVGKQMKDWGVKPAHFPFSYGSSFPPSLQSAIMQQLGPVTLLIGLCETTSQAYQEKWVKAAVGQMSGVPNMASIANVLKGSKTKHKELVSGVLDLVGLGIAKQSHKASFPWPILRSAMPENTLVQWIQTFSITQDENAMIYFVYGAKLTDKTIPSYVGDIDYSGKKMWYAYNEIAGKATFKLKGIEGANNAVYAQWLSYSVTGLWMEDVAILKHIFEVEPVLRKDYGNAIMPWLLMKHQSLRRGTSSTMTDRRLPLVDWQNL